MIIKRSVARTIFVDFCRLMLKRMKERQRNVNDHLIKLYMSNVAYFSAAVGICCSSRKVGNSWGQTAICNCN